MMTGRTRILFITLSNIGDAVMTTPVLQALYEKFPDSVIDIVGDRRSIGIFQHCPYRGRLILKEKRNGFVQSVRFLLELRKTRYDLVVDLRTDGLAYLLRARQRLTKKRASEENMHAVLQHMSVIRDLQIDQSVPETIIWIDQDSEAYADSVLNILPEGKWLAIGPGCGGPEKVWPGPCYRDMAASCSGLFSAVILVGGSGDWKYAEIVENGLSGSHINLCGKTDLLQVAAILKRCSMYIGSDSGLGHLAGAVSTPTVTLFGVGSPERYHPWGSRAAWIRGEDRDMEKIPVEQVVECVQTHYRQMCLAGHGL